MELFLGNEKKQILINGIKYMVMDLPTNINIYEEYLLSKNNYILKDQNDLYLIPKESE
jgi:hypothetical protein